MKVIEIFKSIDGEGLRTGKPVSFIRLEGCNLRCSYCDTKYSYEKAKYTEMSVDDILTAVGELGLKRVTLTGGEPLIHKDVVELVAKLSYHGFEVNIETNGSISIRKFEEDVKLAEGNLNNILYTVDYKCYSSGMSNLMDMDNFRYLSTSDHVIKFVVGNREDLLQMSDIVMRCDLMCDIYVSPVFGSIDASEIVNFILEREWLHDCTVQVQLHKIIWEPETRGV